MTKYRVKDPNAAKFRRPTEGDIVTYTGNAEHISHRGDWIIEQDDQDSLPYLLVAIDSTGKRIRPDTDIWARGHEVKLRDV